VEQERRPLLFYFFCHIISWSVSWSLRRNGAAVKGGTKGRVRGRGAAEAAVWRRHGWGGHWGGGPVLGCSSIWG